METSLYEYVLGELEKRRGEWRAIASGSGVAFSTVNKIGYRYTPNPGVRHIEKLATYFRAHRRVA